MADNSGIEWTDATWNPITGCWVVSPGCTNCYAMRLAGTRMHHHPSRAGLTRDSKAGPVWTGEVRLNEQWLDQPMRWRRPRRIFVCAHGDLFHESVPDEWIDRVFAVMALAPWHTFQVLTKRAARMRAYFRSWPMDPRRPDRITELAAKIGHTIPGLRGSCGAMARPLPNVWMGVSAEDQPRADERIPLLLATPAAVRWVSVEPSLGAVDLTNLDYDKHLDSMRKTPRPNPLDPDWPQLRYDALRGHMKGPDDIGMPRLDWVVAGGESGPGARPSHPDWFRSLRDQCAEAGVPFHFKQWGEWVSVSEVAGPGEHYNFPDGATVRRVGKSRAGRTLDGVLHDGYPGGAA